MDSKNELILRLKRASATLRSGSVKTAISLKTTEQKVQMSWGSAMRR